MEKEKDLEKLIDEASNFIKENIELFTPILNKKFNKETDKKECKQKECCKKVEPLEFYSTLNRLFNGGANIRCEEKIDLNRLPKEFVEMYEEYKNNKFIKKGFKGKLGLEKFGDIKDLASPLFTPTKEDLTICLNQRIDVKIKDIKCGEIKCGEVFELERPYITKKEKIICLTKKNGEVLKLNYDNFENLNFNLPSLFKCSH